jgi:CRP-like cAMP-binding protein
MVQALVDYIRRQIPLSLEEESIVLELFHEKTYKKGEHLLSEGDVCRHITFIEEGLVRYYFRQNGEERTNYFNKEGEFVCDYVSFLPKQPTIVNIQAVEDCMVRQVSYEGIQQFYQRVAHGERFGRLALEAVFVNIVAQVASVYTDPPEARYRNFLLNYPDVAQRIPQYYIASYVGVQPQSLSRIRKRLSKDIN